MPFCVLSVWFLTSTRSPAARATPSTVCNPESVILAVVATRTGSLIAAEPEMPVILSTAVLVMGAPVQECPYPLCPLVSERLGALGSAVQPGGEHAHCVSGGRVNHFRLRAFRRPFSPDGT